MKIFLIHFAGGNKYSYNKILKQKGIHLEIDRSLVNNNIKLIVKDLLRDFENISNDSYIIYGHSMGALIGYLICQKLQSKGLSMPKKLVVSGKKAPNIPREREISHLQDNEFWNEILKYFMPVFTNKILIRIIILYYIPETE